MASIVVAWSSANRLDGLVLWSEVMHGEAYVKLMFLAPLVCLIPFLFLAVVTFDRLVMIEYARFRSEWDSDGEPDGFFWHPPDRSLFSSLMSTFAKWSVGWEWLFRTPPWMEHDDEAIALLRRYRICVLIWNLGIVAWFAIMIVVAIVFS
jgi:hypothetical protein